MKKIALLMVVLILSASACIASFAYDMVTTEVDFKGVGDKIYQDKNLVWTFPERSKITDLGLELGTDWYAVGQNKKLGLLNSGFEAWVDFQTKDEKPDDLIAIMVGIRNKANTDIFLNGGLWLAVREKQISVLAGAKLENAVKITNLPYNFDKMRRLLIVDDGTKTNVFIDKKLTAIIEYNENNVIVKGSDGAEIGVIKDVKLENSGYFRVMPHFANGIIEKMGNKSIDDPKFTEKYVPYNKLNYRDVYSDTWVATDELNRTIANYEQAREPQNKKVGIFYLIWHDADIHGGDGKIYNTSETFLEGGIEGVWASLVQGPRGFAHYWAEPYLGYYRSNDEWVIRKHAEQMANAGIDFIFLDNTNGITYMDTYEKMFKIYRQIREEGGKTPQIAFWVASDSNNNSAPMIDTYNNIYSLGRYKDLWFMWDGKPLMLTTGIATPQQEVSDEIQSFFTIKQSWANSKDGWYTDTNGKDCWIWSDMTPQGVGKDANGNVEQMPVMCGFWANGSYGTNAGRSYYKGNEPKTTNFGFDLMETSAQGLAFSEQFEHAFEVDPKVIMITGWNEWWAGRWDNTLPNGGNPAQGQTIGNTYVVDKDDPIKRNYYVDSLSPEYSRDIEAMKGGFGDNYYWQMVDGLRTFSGARPIPASNMRATIDMNSFEQWSAIGPEYRDNIGDTAHRNCKSYVGGLTYVNNSGRNDIKNAKVTRDDEFVYFYVETIENIVKDDGTNWMNLFIDVDQKHSTGWQGYDFIINRQRDGELVSIEANANNSWQWNKVASASYKLEVNKLQIKVKQSDLKIDFTKGFDFKWADNSVNSGAVMEFMDLGDSAPAERFNFRYIETEAPFKLSEKINAAAKDKIVLMINKNAAFVNSERKYIDLKNASVMPLIYEGSTMVPVRFIAEGLGAEVLWDEAAKKVTLKAEGKTIEMIIDSKSILVNGSNVQAQAPAKIINGRTMLPLRTVCELVGKTLTWDDRGLIIIGNETVSDADFIEIMVNSL